MADRRSRLDFAAYGLLVAGLVVALSIFSHDPADPPVAAVYPPHDTAKNILGTGGAWLAQTLNETLGVAVYLLLVSWFVLIVLLFLRQSLIRWSLRLLGWLLLVPCAAIAADYFGPHFSYGPLAGGGGSLGAWLRVRLETSFQPFGAASVFGASLFLGLVLTADSILLKIARGLWIGMRWLVGRTADLTVWTRTLLLRERTSAIQMQAETQ